MEENNKKRGRPRKPPEDIIQVQRPINNGPKQNL